MWPIIYSLRYNFVILEESVSQPIAPSSRNHSAHNVVARKAQGESRARTAAPGFRLRSDVSNKNLPDSRQVDVVPIYLSATRCI